MFYKHNLTFNSVMFKLAVLLSLLFVPLTSLSQEMAENLRCDIKSFSREATNPSQYVEIAELSKQLEQELSDNNHVIICFLQQYESMGHGIFGLVDWDERKIAELEISKFTNGEYPVITANGRGHTAQRAPLGTWHTVGDTPMSSWQAMSPATDLKNVLLGVRENLLDNNHNFSATILALE